MDARKNSRALGPIYLFGLLPLCLSFVTGLFLFSANAVASDVASPHVSEDCKALRENKNQILANKGRLGWYVIGEMYEKGVCGEPEYDKAARHFIQAASQGFDYAYPVLANLYLSGLGIEEDKDEARYWIKMYVLENLRNSADKNTNNLRRIMSFRGVPDAFHKEVAWGESLMQASPSVKYEMAQKLRKGDGVPMHSGAAVTLLEDAIKEGLIEAKYELGRGLIARDYPGSHLGREYTLAQATILLTEASRKRLAPAERELGIYLLRHGKEATDKGKAYVLFLLAKEDGAKNVDEYIAELETSLSEGERKRALRLLEIMAVFP